MPPLFIAGGVVPPFYLFLIGAAFVIGLALWLVIDKTRLGKTIRAAAHNPSMVAALGINTGFSTAWCSRSAGCWPDSPGRWPRRCAR
jgi:Branched-chain amino acid ABC-type transport system, permease components